MLAWRSSRGAQLPLGSVVRGCVSVVTLACGILLPGASQDVVRQGLLFSEEPPAVASASSCGADGSDLAGAQWLCHFLQLGRG